MFVLFGQINGNGFGNLQQNAGITGEILHETENVSTELQDDDDGGDDDGDDDSDGDDGDDGGGDDDGGDDDDDINKLRYLYF